MLHETSTKQKTSKEWKNQGKAGQDLARGAKNTRWDCVSTQVTKKDRECMLPNKQELKASDMEKDKILSLLSQSSLAIRPPSHFSLVPDPLDSCAGS